MRIIIGQAAWILVLGLCCLYGEGHDRARRTGDKMLADVTERNTDGVRAALAAGVPADYCDVAGYDALFYAAQRGDQRTLQCLLDAGASPRRVYPANVTALMAAAGSGNERAVKTLLIAGAKVNQQSRQGSTALMVASGFGFPAIVSQLLAAGADPWLKDRTGYTALRTAREEGGGDDGPTARLLRRAMDPSGSCSQCHGNTR